MRVKKMYVRFFLVFFLVFLFSLSSVLLRVDAVTFEEAQEYGKKIAAGTFYSAALKMDGTVSSWGQFLNVSGNYEGIYRIISAQSLASGLSNVTAIAAGDDHFLALHANGTVSARGFNGRGWANYEPRPCGVPSSVQGSTVAIAAGTWQSIAIKNDGTIEVWGPDACSWCTGGCSKCGWHNKGQGVLPVVNGTVVAVAGGAFHSLALNAAGCVTAWGNKNHYRFTNENNYGFNLCNAPSSARIGVRAIAAGNGHSLALKNDGTVIAWGWNGYGQCRRMLLL